MALHGVVDIVTWQDEEIKNTAARAPWLDDYADKEGIEVAVIVVAEDEDAAMAAAENVLDYSLMLASFSYVF